MFNQLQKAPWALLLAFASLSGCHKEESRPSEETQQEEDAGAVDKAAQLDPSLAKAVAAASAKTPPPQAGAPGGPPPKGIFGPGEADKQIKKGQPPVITLGSQGAEPRVELVGSSFRPGTKVKGSIQVAVQSDPRQGALPVDFALSFEAKASPPGAGADGLTDVVAKVDSASVAAVGLPQELAGDLKKLKGSRIEYKVARNGAGVDFTPVIAKGAEQSPLEQSFRALNDALATITLPYPSKPVGTGAFWMATTREGVMGLDLVTYRLIRVQRADAGQVTLTVETKRYAAGNEFNVAGLPGEYKLDEFQSVADGTAMIALGRPLPHKGLMKLNLGALLVPVDKPTERGTLQVQGQARFNFGDLDEPTRQAMAQTHARPATAQPPAAQPARPTSVPPAPPSAPAPGN